MEWIKGEWSDLGESHSEALAETSRRTYELALISQITTAEKGIIKNNNPITYIT